jgi:beta-lactamase regulating signal transducer with metallopeptidase domain
VFRPVLFICERVLRECPPEEIRAMLRHEAAHVTVRDNLKRFLIRACPDMLRAGGALDRAWALAAEEAADAAAVAAQPGSAVELAQALIRVARIAPTSPAPELASAFYLGGSIETRVRHLIGAPQADMPIRAGLIAVAAAGLCVAAMVFFSAPTLHQAMEVAVHYLP